MVGSSECGNETLAPIKCGEFLDYGLLNKGSSPRNELTTIVLSTDFF
jgi:hypothetical protein